jgi:hypothetical protein
MAEPIQRGGQEPRRLADQLLRHAGSVEETPDTELWDAPGHDGVIGDAETDPDRTDLRSEIGWYVSLATFPVKARSFVAIAEQRNASDTVLAYLRSLEPDRQFADSVEVWAALGLSTGRRF